MSLSSPYQDPALCRALLDRLQTALDGRELRFMEVCGTHTVSIFQSGLRSLLPKEVTHLSGPGCPVCVTHDAEVAAFLDLAGRDGVIIATFGDLLRVRRRRTSARRGRVLPRRYDGGGSESKAARRSYDQ